MPAFGASNDFNCGDNEGSCYFHVNQQRGRRWSAARGFLKPVLHRQNLKLETGVLVERVLFEGQRAIGVAYRQDGVEEAARREGRGHPVCRRDRLTADSHAVGCRSRLAPFAQHGIPVVLDRPGVGENLQDHLQLRLDFPH